MKRLTIRNSDGSVSQPTDSTFEKVFNRLAEYEDIGYSPEEIRDMIQPKRREAAEPTLMRSRFLGKSVYVLLGMKYPGEVFKAERAKCTGVTFDGKRFRADKKDHKGSAIEYELDSNKVLTDSISVESALRLYIAGTEGFHENCQGKDVFVIKETSSTISVMLAELKEDEWTGEMVYVCGAHSWSATKETDGISFVPIACFGTLVDRVTELTVLG